MPDADLRVIVSARDAGAARQSEAWVRYCLRARLATQFRLVGSGPATSILRDTGLPVADLSGVADPLCEVRRIVRDFRPEFALLGLAFPGRGVDDVLRQVAAEEGIACGAIQDYWGYLGSFSIDELPDCFFVLDATARELTRDKVGASAPCVITGSPKHQMYSVDDSLCNQKLPANAIKQVTFFGQPRSVPGVLRNLKIFLQALSSVSGPLELNYKLHPNERGDEEFYRELLGQQPYPFRVTPEGQSAETLLTQSHLIVTCFSTVGLDHNYLQLYSREPLGNLLYLQIGEDLQGFLQEQVGIPEVPGSRAGMGQTVHSVSELTRSLQAAIHDDALRAAYHAAVRTNLGSVANPSKAIYDHVRAMLRAGDLASATNK